MPNGVAPFPVLTFLQKRVSITGLQHVCPITALGKLGIREGFTGSFSPLHIDDCSDLDPLAYSPLISSS